MIARSLVPAATKDEVWQLVANYRERYSGVGMFEATNLSVGRGTPTPFELVGAPWVNGTALCQRLSALGLPGLQFSPVFFTPMSEASTILPGLNL